MKEILLIYRDIRRLHKLLPPELKYLGNQYVISEFRLHRKIEPEYLSGFKEAWIHYKDTLKSQLANKVEKLGETMNENRLDDLSKLQLGQLLELKTGAKEVK